MGESLKIGRITDVDALGTVETLSVTKDTMTLTGNITRKGTDGGDLTAVTHVRDQMVGLLDNPDEPIVPFVYSGDRSLDQWVKVRSASVTIPPTGGLQRGYFPWSLTVDRLPQGRPKVECGFLGDVYVNQHTFTAALSEPWHAIPAAASGYGFGSRTDTTYTRTGPGGSVDVWSPGGIPYYSPTDFATFDLPPANAYDMAATIKAGVTKLRPVHGRYMAPGNEQAWEISNGLLKITPGTVSNALLAFTMPVYANPAQWGTTRQIDVGAFAGGLGWFPWSARQIDSVAVIRNSPEKCVLRLWVHYTPSTLASSWFTVDIGLRRGSRFVHLVIKSPIAKQWGAGTTATTGVTTLTYTGHNTGFRQSADDADGNRLGMSMTRTNTQDTTNGRIYASSGLQLVDVGIWGEIGGTGAPAVAPDVYTSVSNQYFAGQTETQRIILP